MPIPIVPPIIPGLLALRSKWAATPIDPNLSINDAVWANPGYWHTEKCWVTAKNDAKFLYIALDVVGDTGNDPNDYFWLTFDVDENKAITASKDVNYGLFPGSQNKLGIQKYLGPGAWTSISTPPESEVRVEFGTSPKSNVAHRIWKFKIALTEIGASLLSLSGAPFTYFGFRVSSTNPAFTADYPANFSTNFANLYKLVFATKPAAPIADLGPVIGTVGLIPTTKIGVNGKATTMPGYYVAVTNAAFGGALNLIANRVTLTALVTASGAAKYRVLHATPGSASFTPLISSWSNYRWNGSDYVPEAFAPNASGLYTLPALGAEYAIDDLLIQFSTYGMAPGKNQFKLEFFQADGVTPVASTPQVVTMHIDNTLPVVKINSIKHGATEVTACAIETIGAAPDGLTFRITANDPEGNLLGYSFYANYGENQTVGIHSQNYGAAVPAGADWSGVTDFLIPTVPANWRPPMTCAYSFVIAASARTTNGYSYIGSTSYFRNLTLLLG